jgi:hypothetical protein
MRQPGSQLASGILRAEVFPILYIMTGGARSCPKAGVRPCFRKGGFFGIMLQAEDACLARCSAARCKQVDEGPATAFTASARIHFPLFPPSTNSPARLSNSSGRCAPLVAVTTSERTLVITVRSSTPGVGNCLSKA